MFGGQVVEKREDVQFGLGGAKFERLVEVFAQSGGGDAEDGDFVVRETKPGKEFDLFAEGFRKLRDLRTRPWRA